MLSCYPIPQNVKIPSIKKENKMHHLLHKIITNSTPFCIIQEQDSEEILFFTGDVGRYRRICEIPRKTTNTKGNLIYDTISVVPFCQIRERGYNVHDNGEEILTIKIREHFEVSTQIFELLPHEEILLRGDISYDTTEQEYAEIIRTIVEKEIGNGEGANFVIPRNAKGMIHSFSVTKALTVFKSLLQNDYGAYWKFIFYDTKRFFIGSTPERHLLVKNDRVRMNPISGTFRKDRTYGKRVDFKKDLLVFLSNQKEINELFMVVDEELKMMSKMCNKGVAIIGPLLKEMSKLIHSEYLLSGESKKDIFELFRDSMFAATVIGSPVENGCNIVTKYSTASRGYYGSAMMLVGRDENNRDFLDSPITIRTAEIDNEGKFLLSVGATLVKDSIPTEEVKETKSKSAAILASLTPERDFELSKPKLTSLYNDDEILETLLQRNKNLSNFWFSKQDDNSIISLIGDPVRITIIHNEDDFVYMLRQMFSSMGVKSKIIRFSDYDISRDTSDITVLGPGPGNPNDTESKKIAINRRITGDLLQSKKNSIFICLGHQILCKTLGFDIERKTNPFQGSQIKINLFGREELVGFYNTFTPKVSTADPTVEISTIPELKELIALRGEHFIGYQFHPESLLTKNGYTILHETVSYLLASTQINAKVSC